ncbi:MAG TPA: glycosyltransferase, partial [Dehalococcoidia bacterium]|nr:glycosyltransferase [Dehalococcoidia bacterium]
MTRTGKPRVLVLTSTFPRWQGDATPRFVADLSEGLTREGLDVTVLAPGSRGAARRELWGNVDVRRFQYSWPAATQRLADGAILPNIRANRLLALQAPPFVLAQLAAAWRLARRERFDVIHAHWVVPQGLVAAMLKRTLGVPVITTTHGADLFALRARPLLAAKRWALQSSDAITTVSDALK